MYPFGPGVRSFTELSGRPWPRTDQDVLVPWPWRAVNTPSSVASAILPPVSTSASDAMSGRFPEMSVQDLPPFCVSNTWPTPPPGTNRREYPLKTAYACAGFDGSTVTPAMYRLGRPAVLTWWQVTP